MSGGHDNLHRLRVGKQMKSKKINLFEFPSNLGLKKKEFEVEPGVKLLPGWLKINQFHNLIAPDYSFTLDPPDYAMDLDEESGVRNTNKIIAYAKDQAKLLSKFINRDSFSIIIGGDCSILIGNALALKQKGDYGLFFLDGHTDYVSPEVSISQAAAAMELAIITGYGHKKLTNISNLGPYILGKNVWCVGNREYDPKVVNEILDSEISYFDLSTLRRVGLKNCTLQFLKMVNENHLDGFLIHLDVDVLNDDIMPAVDSREKDGLNYSELNILLSELVSNDKAIGIEITILDPTLDEEGVYTKKFISNFIDAIEKARTQQ